MQHSAQKFGLSVFNNDSNRRPWHLPSQCIIWHYYRVMHTKKIWSLARTHAGLSSLVYIKGSWLFCYKISLVCHNQIETVNRRQRTDRRAFTKTGLLVTRWLCLDLGIFLTSKATILRQWSLFLDVNFDVKSTQYINLMSHENKPKVVVMYNNVFMKWQWIFQAIMLIFLTNIIH